MPQVSERKQLSTEEMAEFVTTGPFGGIQSELPLTEIEQLGFADINNFILRKGFASVRPGFNTLPLFPTGAGHESIEAVADFFNINGQHIQCVITPTRLFQFTGGVGGWTQINGPAFANVAQLFAWDALNYQLCFSQGSDKIWMWDGVSPNYVQSSVNAPPAWRMAEIGLHLVAINPAFPQRYYFSGIGDPTDWTSFSSGLNDNVSNLGPINGVEKIGQYGFGFHYQGIVQIIPTGIGTAPFYFVPIVNATQGLVAPWSLAHFDDQGQEMCCYLGIDNVYAFNGSSIESIGDMPLNDGSRRRIGARTRILVDAIAVDPRTIYGFVTYSINGQIFRAYWLVIPNVSVYVYNFDESNWTRFTYSKTIVSIGTFFKNQVIEIKDLIGTIAQQSWTPANLNFNNPYQGFALGFNDSVGYVDFTNYSEVGASITSGKIIFGDRRHKHTTKRYRLVVQDQGQATYTITITNEKNVSESHPITLGTGSGDVLAYVQEFKVTGLRIQWKVSVPAGQPGGLVEFAPYYDTAGEQRGGTIDN